LQNLGGACHIQLAGAEEIFKFPNRPKCSASLKECRNPKQLHLNREAIGRIKKCSQFVDIAANRLARYARLENLRRQSLQAITFSAYAQSVNLP